MAFNLGAFAGGLASAGLKTYTTLKEQERLEGIEARDKERFENERLKLQQEKEADEQLRQAAMPGTGGNTLSEIAAALPIGTKQTDVPPEKQALYNELFGRVKPEQQEQSAYREKFNEVFGGLTEKQQEAVLRGYGKVGLPDTEDGVREVSLADKGVYTDESGTRRVGALETDEKKLLENRKRIAAQSGNPIAIKRAEEAETAFLAREASRQGIKKTGYELDTLDRKKLYDQKVDEYSTKQLSIMKVLDSVSEAKLDAVPDIVNKQLGAFGFTANFAGAEGDSPPRVQLKNADGDVVAEYGSSAEVEAAINAQMGAFNASMAKDLVQFLPDAKDRIAAIKDITTMAGEKARLGLEGRRVTTEESNVASQIKTRKDDLALRQKEFEQKAATESARLALEFKASTRDDQRLDLAKKIADTQEAHENTRLGFEASRLAMDSEFGKKRLDLDEARKNIEQKRADTDEARSNWEKDAAKDRNKNATEEIQLNRDKFKEEQKFTPNKLREIDAHINYYNSESSYRKAAAAELANGKWSVLGTDKDGQPISMDSQTGKFARADGKPIQDIDFFRKITGVAPEKLPFTAKDLLEFTQVYGDSEVKGLKDGKAVKLKDLPPDQQAAQARAFFNGTSTLGSGGLDSSVKPAAPPAPAAAADTTAAAAKPVFTPDPNSPAGKAAAQRAALANTQRQSAQAIASAATAAATAAINAKNPIAASEVQSMPGFDSLPLTVKAQISAIVMGRTSAATSSAIPK
jgi:hypothetical protein